ncbi:hypothetical protein [Vibrio sp. NC2]|uniref:capsular polysaccharide export protein, LipB/KpsS family n=1 Tax=Vibrio sp. NC2 TaxID=2974562 RepID=UPI0021A43CFE|nr:hypothetical protein [Vibrio sp. NC2]MCT4349527.1 hypothetical protein [Vibrio sp. NC2]
MNVLTIGYYDDFSRFFLKVKKVLNQQDDQVNHSHFAIYPSGYLYWKLRDRKVELLSFKARLLVLKNYRKYISIVKNQGEYRGIKLSDVISYHLSLGVNAKDLMLQACGYIDAIYDGIKKNNIDIIICSSDSRLASEVAAYISKMEGIKILYFEQGPFNTTALDTKGVNANASIRGKVFLANKEKEKNIKSNLSAFYGRDRYKKYKRSPFYRAGDYIINFIFGKTKILPPEMKNTTYNTVTSKFKRKIKRESSHKLTSECKEFLLILQVPFDVNMVYHSPNFVNHYEIVKAVSDNLPKGTYLTVREHPLYKNGYENELYELCASTGISIESDKDLKLALDEADVIIVNNSTVGLESISNNKPTVVLGNALYDSSDICLKLDSTEKLRFTLQSSLSYKVDSKLVCGFLNELYFKYYITGHYRDDDINKLCKDFVDRIEEVYRE